MGSLVYIGEVTGSLIAMPAYKWAPVKLVLITCIVCQSVCVLGFAFSSENYKIMAASRYFTGVFQVFISIFGPIWCDIHAPDNKKTTWITSFIVATPGGMVTGYLITAIILSCGGSWTWSFYLQVILLVPVAIYIASIGHRFLDLKKREPSLAESTVEDTDDMN